MEVDNENDEDEVSDELDDVMYHDIINDLDENSEHVSTIFLVISDALAIHWSL